MKRRLIVLLAGLAYIMPAAAQQTLFDRYAEKQGVTYVNINGEIIKTLLPDMSDISIKEINILDIDNRQLLQSIDKDLQQCIKDEKYKQLIKTVDSLEKRKIFRQPKRIPNHRPKQGRHAVDLDYRRHAERRFGKAIKKTLKNKYHEVFHPYPCLPLRHVVQQADHRHRRIRQPIRPSICTYAGHPHALGEKETPQSGH